MNILVTGVAGYIGSNLCEYLLSKGHQVVGIDNFNDYYAPKLKEFNISTFIKHQSFTLHRTDITDIQNLKKIFESIHFDAVFHLAAWAGVTPSIKLPHIYALNNYIGTDNIADQCVKAGVKKLIFASTSSVYGTKNKTPYTEDMDSSSPVAPYPASKKACEVLLHSYSKNFDISVIIFRYFNPIGPRLRPDLAIPKLIRAHLYGGAFPITADPTTTARDFTNITDMLEVHDKAIDLNSKYEIINLGNSNPVNLNELIKTVEEVTGHKTDRIESPQAGQMEVTYADISKAKLLLGYNPSSTLKQMVNDYYSWFLKQPEWYKKGEY